MAIARILDLWAKIIPSAGWFTREARGKFIHYRILPWYFTAVRLHETGLLENNLCWNSKGQVGNFIHVMWACPLVLPLW